MPLKDYECQWEVILMECYIIDNKKAITEIILANKTLLSN